MMMNDNMIIGLSSKWCARLKLNKKKAIII